MFGAAGVNFSDIPHNSSPKLVGNGEGEEPQTSPDSSNAPRGASTLPKHHSAHLLRSRASTKTLVAKKAVQDRDDFGMLLTASFCLCFNAGMVNVITMSSYFQLTTAHVTGLVAKTSVFLADEDWHYVYLPATTFLAFLLGSIMAGYTVSYETFYLGRTYGRQLLMIASLQAIALIVDKAKVSDAATHHNYVYACAVGCGLQNGLTSKYSGNTIRTTHLTGATTDLGIAIGHILKGRLGDVWKVKLHTIAVLGFLLGGVFGRLGYQRFQETALVFNISILALLGLAHMIYIAHYEQLPLFEVAKSRVDIKIHRHHTLDKQATPEEYARQSSFRRLASQRNLQRMRSNGLISFANHGSFRSTRSDPNPLGTSKGSLKGVQMQENLSFPYIPGFLSRGSSMQSQTSSGGGFTPTAVHMAGHSRVSFEGNGSSGMTHPHMSNTLGSSYYADAHQTTSGLPIEDLVSESEKSFEDAEHPDDFDEYAEEDIAAEDSDVEGEVDGSIADQLRHQLTTLEEGEDENRLSMTTLDRPPPRTS